MSQIGPKIPQSFFTSSKQPEEEDEDTSKYEFGIEKPSATEKLTQKEAEQIMKIQKSQPHNTKHYVDENNPAEQQHSYNETADQDDLFDAVEEEQEDSIFDGINLDEVEINIRMLLVGSREVGKIMGKGGKTLNNCRTVSGCKIHITNPPEIEDSSKILKNGKTLKSSCERILTLTGKRGQITTALEMLSGAIDRELNMIIEKKRTIEPIVFKIIVPKTLKGVIIGRKGAMINQLRKDSNAKVDITNSCLPDSTELLLTISGDVEESPAAGEMIVNLILSDGIKRAKHGAKYGAQSSQPETVSYIPKIHSKFLLSSTKTARDREMDEKFEALKLSFDLAQNNGIPPPTLKSLKTRILSVDKQEVRIPGDQIGSIIGSMGSRIDRVRELSGAHVKVFPPIENEHLRTIWVQGKGKQIQMAVYLMNCCRDLYGDNVQGKMNNPFERQADGSFKYQLGEWLSGTNAKAEEQLVIKSFFDTYQQKLAQKGTRATGFNAGYNADDENEKKRKYDGESGKTGKVVTKKSKKSKKDKKPYVPKDEMCQNTDYKLDDKRGKQQKSGSFNHFSGKSFSDQLSDIPLPAGAAPNNPILVTQSLNHQTNHNSHLNHHLNSKPFAETSPFLASAAPKVYNPEVTRSGKLSDLADKVLGPTMENIKKRQQQQQKYSQNPKSVIQEEDDPFQQFG